MAYSDFRYPDVIAELGLTWGNGQLFTDVLPLPALPETADMLTAAARLGSIAHTGYARAVWMVGPLLADFWGRYDGRISAHAGVELDGDPAAGLVGPCDFVLARSHQWMEHVPSPVTLVVRTGPNSPGCDLGPVIAATVGAQRRNRAAGKDTGPVYGCETNGSEWQFVRLDGRTLTLDLVQYQLSQPDRILGILAHIIGPVPAAAA